MSSPQSSPDWPEEEYPCLGICEMDPETGYCLGCGRPPDYVRREEIGNTGSLDSEPRPSPEPDKPLPDSGKL